MSSQQNDALTYRIRKLLALTYPPPFTSITIKKGEKMSSTRNLLPLLKTISQEIHQILPPHAYPSMYPYPDVHLFDEKQSDSSDYQCKLIFPNVIANLVSEYHSQFKNPWAGVLDKYQNKYTNSHYSIGYYCLNLLSENVSNGAQQALSALTSEEEADLLNKWKMSSEISHKFLRAYFLSLKEWTNEELELLTLTEDLKKLPQSLVSALTLKASIKTGGHGLIFTKDGIFKYNNVEYNPATVSINLDGANLTLNWLRKTHTLNMANFSKASLVGINFSNNNLIKSNFNDANVTKADFSMTRLDSASFRGAILCDANLSRAGLCDTDFSNAILTGANLESIAAVRGASFRGADLRGAKVGKGKSGLFSPISLLDIDLRDALLDSSQMNIIREAIPEVKVNSLFQPLINYLHFRKNPIIELLFSTRPFDEYFIALRLLGAKSKIELEKRVKEIPESFINSKRNILFTNALAKTIENFNEQDKVSKHDYKVEMRSNK
jgi:hypothetical protein